MSHPQQPPPYSPQYEKPPPYAPGTGDQVHPQYGAPNAGWMPPGSHHTQTTVIMPQSGYGSTVLVEPVTMPATQVIIVGGCPSCRVGVLEDSFSCFGLCCAIIFFPIGILCCLAMRSKQCTNCGASF